MSAGQSPKRPKSAGIFEATSTSPTPRFRDSRGSTIRTASIARVPRCGPLSRVRQPPLPGSGRRSPLPEDRSARHAPAFRGPNELRLRYGFKNAATRELGGAASRPLFIGEPEISARCRHGCQNARGACALRWNVIAPPAPAAPAGRCRSYQMIQRDSNAITNQLIKARVEMRRPSPPMADYFVTNGSEQPINDIRLGRSMRTTARTTPAQAVSDKPPMAVADETGIVHRERAIGSGTICAVIAATSTPPHRPAGCRSPKHRWSVSVARKPVVQRAPDDGWSDGIVGQVAFTQAVRRRYQL